VRIFYKQWMRVLSLLLLCIALAAPTALAVPPGWTVRYAGAEKGAVVFSGEDHAVMGLVCLDCHLTPFGIARRNPAAAMPFEDHTPGRLCGTCHNGDRAFSIDSPSACRNCHKEAPAGAFPEAETPPPAMPNEVGPPSTPSQPPPADAPEGGGHKPE
jgi:c(7)-type cytochrome triheme protein